MMWIIMNLIKVIIVLNKLTLKIVTNIFRKKKISNNKMLYNNKIKVKIQQKIKQKYQQIFLTIKKIIIVKLRL